MLHEPVLPESPHKQRRTRAPFLSPSDDDDEAEKETELDSTKDKSFRVPSAEKHANWRETPTTQRRNRYIKFANLKEQ
jgi:hypothetical protein